MHVLRYMFLIVALLFLVVSVFNRSPNGAQQSILWVMCVLANAAFLIVAYIFLRIKRRI